jgi:hypothetical protein
MLTKDKPIQGFFPIQMMAAGNNPYLKLFQINY